MKLVQRLILKIILPVLLVACAPYAARAQDDDGPKLKMPCTEVLKLGLDSFMDVYGEKTQDYSTLGQKQALSYYVDCKRPVNDAEAERLGPAKLKQVNAVRDDLAKLGEAVWNMRYIKEGGGTMWGLASVGAYAEREDFMTTLIAALALPEKKDAGARRRANANLAKAQRLLARWSRTPNIEVFGGDSVAVQKKLYQSSVGEAQEAVAALQALIRTLPDMAAECAARRMADELAAALED